MTNKAAAPTSILRPSNDSESVLRRVIMAGRSRADNLFNDVLVTAEGAVATIAVTAQILIWQTITDFNKGTFTNTIAEVSGSNDVVHLDDETDLTDDVDYETAGDYTLSDGTKIEVASGIARLKALSGSDIDFPFTIPSNYTLSDATKIQILGGEAVLRVENVVGHWHLNESSGSNVSDDSGKGNDGTATNMEDGDWVSAKLGNGLLFGGIDEFVTFGNIADFERTDSFSLEFWFKTTTSSAELILTKQLNSGTFRGYNVFIESGVITTALISDNGASNRLQLKTNGTFNDDVLHHCVITYDGSSTLAGLNIFIDAVDVATTNVTDNLSATISNAADLQLSGRSGANVVFNGTLDEVVVYSTELSSGDVTTRFNSGTGTEILTGTYPTDDPTVINVNGFVFSAALSGFTEIAVKTDSQIQYHVSSDGGVTFKFWNGSAWVVTDGTFAQSNTATVVNTNIAVLASSGTFKFRTLLHSNDGSNTPALDNINVAEANVFSLTDDLHIDTKDASQIDTSTVITFLTANITNILPANTDIRVLVSTNDRVSWLTWNGVIWTAPTSDTDRDDATSIGDFESNLVFLTPENTLNIRLFLQTTDASMTPQVLNINVTGDAGLKTSGNWESNIFDATVISQPWRKIFFNLTLPSGTTVVIEARASNSATMSGGTIAYSGPFSNTEESNLTGQFFQFRVTFTGTVSARSDLKDVAMSFITPEISQVTP